MKKVFLLSSKILANISIGLFGIVTVGSSIAMKNSSAISSFFGESTQMTIDTGNSEKPMYYDSKYTKVEDLRKDSEAMVEEVVGEGAVLLKNDNNALPLSSNAKVNLYSANSVNFVYTGGGSSGANPKAVSDCTDLKTGLESAGLSVNSSLWDFYSSNTQYWQGSDFSGNQNQPSYMTGYYTVDAAFNELPSAKNDDAEAAIMVLSRTGGENSDLYRNTNEIREGKGDKGLETVSKTMSSGNYLQLSDNEIDVLKNLKSLKDQGKIKKIVVVMNSASQIQCDFVDDPDYDIDSLLWVGTTGSTGTKAIGKILTGAINPSGKLSDTFFYTHDANPVYDNYGGLNLYNDSDILFDGFQRNAHRHYVVYQEGIYNGYKYTETRYEDSILSQGYAGEYDYSKVVSYPFGYGLSYSKFKYSDYKVEKKTSSTGSVSYEASVTVTNKGTKAGKEAVELYLQKPYTDYDYQMCIEKPSVELVGYDKTKELQPEESQTITVSVDEKYFASYDSHWKKTYVIGSDNTNDKYYLTIGSDAHEAVNNILATKGKTTSDGMTSAGDSGLVYSTYIPFSDTKYSTNDVIDENNEDFTPDYEGQEANFGVSKITNQFDDCDYQSYDGFSLAEQSQQYISRADWIGTVGTQVTLTASEKLKNDQLTEVLEKDNIPYPTMGVSNGINLITLLKDDSGNYIDYDNELWDSLLDEISWDEMVSILKDGLRATQSVTSVNAPKTYQQNGAVGPVQPYGTVLSGNEFEGFANYYQSGVGEYPTVFPCNGIVASTFNPELEERLGEQIGEECLWVGYAGIYGLGVNIHRGAYCGRTFEYYSEDAFLSGLSCGYEVKGIQSKGVFVILKHALLNETENYRHGINAWANEQTIRENYLRPVEIALEVGDEKGMMGIMTGLNRIGAKWTSAQGFCNTVLRAEYDMKGFIISDYYHNYMTPIVGVMYGTDLPDGQTGPDGAISNTKDGQSLDFNEYKTGYGKFAWAMRESVHRVLYTVVRSAQMNKISSSTKIIKITPNWQKALTGVTIGTDILFGLSLCYLVVVEVLSYIKPRKKDEA